VDETQYGTTFELFLNGYWGAFHEVLEAQSVMPDRLSGSLLNDLVEAHRRFASASHGKAQSAVEALGRLWSQVEERRTYVPDRPLTPEQIARAREQFVEIHDELFLLGKAFPAVRADVLARALHGSPRDPLRVDAAR
jgi:hypothetical protein